MFNISQYLEKFRRTNEAGRNLKEKVSSAIREVVGVEVRTEDIVVKDGQVILKTSPTIKNSVYIKQEQILKNIKENTGCTIGRIR